MLDPELWAIYWCKSDSLAKNFKPPRIEHYSVHSLNNADGNIFASDAKAAILQFRTRQEIDVMRQFGFMHKFTAVELVQDVFDGMDRILELYLQSRVADVIPFQYPADNFTYAATQEQFERFSITHLLVWIF